MTYYYVVFQPRLTKRRSRWWHYILDKKWSHCFVLAKANGGTMVVDPLFWGIKCDVLSNALEDVLLLFLDKGCFVLEWESRIDESHRWRPRGLYTCVSLVKAILNYRSYSITPRQLYKSLLRNGANPWRGQ